MLRRMGFTRVRPLAGGYYGWRDGGFPVEPFDFAHEQAADPLRPVWAF